MSIIKLREDKSRSFDLMGSLERKKMNHLIQAHQHLKRKTFDFYTIFDLSRNLNSLLDLPTLLDNILYTCITQLEVRGAAIIIQPNPRAKKLDLIKIRGFDIDKKINFKIDSPLMDLLGKRQKPLFLNDIIKALKPHNSDITRLKLLKAEVVVPLIIKEKISGILIITPKIPSRIFDEDDLEFLSILVNQAAVAVENAILYQSEKDSYLELKKTQKQLIQTERLAALGQLSAKLAHEINNPLGIIKNYLTILCRSLKEKDKRKEYIRHIKSEVNRITKIIKQLFEFHRPKKERPCRVNLLFLVNETLNLVEEQFSQKNIKITRDFCKKVPLISAYPDQLKQVFLNLLMNSKDFMPQGGKVYVSLSNKKDCIEIGFADTGCGIPQSNLNKIFDPFFTTKSEDKGLGLGLWISYGIISKHGGMISVKNREKGGTSFLISLPKKRNQR
jgi:signal transduction histidine kinase